MDDGEGTANTVIATVEIPFGEQSFRAELRLPAGPTRPTRLLPLFRGLADAFVGMAQESVAASGKTISCTKGCAACCRTLVPVAEVEARRLRDLVDSMPDGRRQAVRERFQAARQRLAASGLLERLDQLDALWGDDLLALIADYFRLSIACPFLEDEACSIYEERPIACREHMVTSPAERCARLPEAEIERVGPRVEVSRALRCFNADRSAPKGWMALISALDWADAQEEERISGTGPELVKAFFALLLAQEAGKSASGDEP
jgi:Fe-S-cluster containining protein